MKEKRLNLNSIRRVIIAVFCIGMAVCVSLVLFFMYKPMQNSFKALSSVSMDVVCMIILFILIGSFAFGNYSANRTSRLFAELLLATEWALFLDFLNWAFDGSLKLSNMTFWFTVGSLCMGSVLAGIFSLYLYKYMDKTHSLSKMRLTAHACVALNIASFVITFALALTGTAFSFVDGHYEVGVLYDAVTIVPILSLLYLLGYAIRYVKKIGVRDVLAVAGYMFIMIAGALIEAGFGIGTTYVAVAIADIYIFVMLQNEIITLERQNVQQWMIRSNTDELTGFYNRNAYESDLAILDNSPISDDFVYVSVDVNSLKDVNDTFGHNAGDELIIGAAKCLEKKFGSYGKIYRTGGDEFIALVHMDDAGIESINKDLDALTENWKGKYVGTLAVSCGYVTGKEAKEMSIRQIAILADKRMYESKNEYYRQRGIERRKN